MFERHKQPERSRPANSSSVKLLLCLSAVLAIIALTQTLASSDRAVARAALRALRRHVPSSSTGSPVNMLFWRKADGRPIPQNITDTPVGVNYTCTVTFNALSPISGYNYVYVDLDANGRAAYTPPGYMPPVPPATDPTHGWPYTLNLNGQTTLSTSITLTAIPGQPAPASFSNFAYPQDGNPNRPTARTLVASQASILQAASAGFQPMPAGGQPMPAGGQPMQNGSVVDASVLLSTITFDPPTVIGGHNTRCTVVLKQPITREDERAGRNVFWVDCENPRLVYPRRSQWPYKRLRFRRGDISASFELHTRELNDADNHEALGSVYVYFKYDDPLYPPVVSTLVVTDK